MAKKHTSHKSSSKEAEDGKVCALLSYILIGVIWYFVDEKMKKNKFANFHAKQGLVLFIAWLIYSIAISVIGQVLWFIWTIWWLLSLVPWIFVVIGIIAAVNGEEKELPIIGHFSSKFKF